MTGSTVRGLLSKDSENMARMSDHRCTQKQITSNIKLTSQGMALQNTSFVDPYAVCFPVSSLNADKLYYDKFVITYVVASVQSTIQDL